MKYMTFIAILVWEALVVYFAYGFWEAVNENSKGTVEDFLSSIVILLVVLGLAILPFTSAFSPG